MAKDLLVFGTLGFDSVTTPFGKIERGFGGSGAFAAVAASHFIRPAMVGAIGKDFDPAFIDVLEKRRIDTSGLFQKNGKSFSWKAHYGFDVNTAFTDEVDPSILFDYDPVVPERFHSSRFVLLGNSSPDHQLRVLDQIRPKPLLSVCDTMNYYIEKEPAKVKHMVRTAHIGLMNDAEARQLFNTPNLRKAANEILDLDSRFAIIKKGEHGAVLFTRKGFFSVPGYPLENVRDPTGCGDSFAGAFLGYLAQQENQHEKNVRKAMVWGSVVASFNAEDFSFKRQLELTKTDLRDRYNEFKSFVRF